MALEQELETYERELPSLKGSEGKFVLIHGDKVQGIYDTWADTLKVGYDTFGLKPFLVKQIEIGETIYRFTRDVAICRT